MSNANKILLLVFLLVAVIALIGIVMWNKPHKNVNDIDTVKVAADDLYDAFLKDSATAKKLYINKAVEVTGEVAQVSANKQYQTVIQLKTTIEGAYINCTLEQKEAVANVGTKIVIKGFCNGYNSGDEDMGIPGDVILVSCYVAK